ncbi:MAG: hypothetical protein DMG73_21010 [Acidobacteria bacterium]|nr:MAG: hypothetical protein DMG73_21010 [Acidobacteriota bacterium]
MADAVERDALSSEWRSGHGLIGIPSYVFTLLRENLPYFFSESLYQLSPLKQLLIYTGDSLAKFMLSLRDENFKLLTNEAEDRGITVQELIRAVIIPDWVKINPPAKQNINGNTEKIRPYQQVSSREHILQAVGRLRD